MIDCTHGATRGLLGRGMKAHSGRRPASRHGVAEEVREWRLRLVADGEWHQPRAGGALVGEGHRVDDVGVQCGVGDPEDLKGVPERVSAVGGGR